MRRLCCAAAVLLAAAGPAGAAELKLQRVVLSSGGVGYFEYAAAVDGNTTLALDVPLAQIDDILKSLVVYDPDGTVGELTLPGREPLSQGFVDLPFDRNALNTVPNLLNALQGAEVKIGGAKPLQGRVLRVVAETARDKDLALTRHRVSLLTGAGIEQFVLEDADSVAFVDPELQKQLAAALTRVAAYRAGGLRRLSLESRGAGHRTVRVGYVVGVPLWKASYRLTLSDDKADHARLQGWAVLENFSGHAWQGVELTLLSGNPVTFRQALYESYYVQRPTVPVEVAGRVLPPADTGAVELAQERNLEAPRGKAARTGGARAFDQAAAAPGAPPMAEMAPAPAPAPARIEAAATAESATETAFTLPNRVNVEAGQSLVVPLLDRAVPAQSVDLYQPAADPRHPLAAVALVNDGKSGLPPGVLTLYEQPASAGALYLGDARLAAFPPGEKRLLSYAVDSKVTVDRSVAQRQTTLSAAIAQGVLRLKRQLRQTTTYRVATQNPGEHRLVIEQPRQAGWELTAPDPAHVELTAGAYRIPASVAAGSQTTLAVTLERPLEEVVRLADLGDDRLGAFLASGDLTPAVKKALADIAGRRQALAKRTAELERLQQQRDHLVEDEKRLRANLAAIGRDTALYKQTLDKLAQSETEITTLAAAIAKGTAEIDAARQQLASFIGELTI